MNATMNSSTSKLCIYGESLMAFHSVAAHAHLARSYWSGYEGEFRVSTMHWYIKKVRSFHFTVSGGCIKIYKGATVQEDIPKTFQYYAKYTVKEGPPTEITSIIQAFSDPNNSGAPQLNTRKPGNCNVSDTLTGKIAAEIKDLVAVTVDFRKVPYPDFKVTVGLDGLSYYIVNYSVQMTCYSAYTKYELVYKGLNYGPVTAEYV